MQNMRAPQDVTQPTAGRLTKATLIAAAVAAVLHVTVVMPAEFGSDITGIGRILGLTQQGEIKQQLAAEAAADAPSAAPAAAPADNQALARIEARLATIEKALINLPYQGGNQTTAPAEAAPAPAVEPEPAPRVASVEEAQPVEPATGDIRSDVFEATLEPGQGVEVKLVVKQGDQIEFAWESTGGVINYDYHGRAADGSAEESFKIERGISSRDGTIEAPYDGQVGWFFRNRGDKPVSVKLNTKGNYIELKQTM